MKFDKKIPLKACIRIQMRVVYNGIDNEIIRMCVFQNDKDI